MITRISSFARPVVLPVLLLLLYACTGREDIPVDKIPRTTGLMAPVVLQPDSTVLILQDYFLRPVKLDSVRLDPSLTFTISADTTRMVILTGRKAIPKMSGMTFWIKGIPYSLLLERSRKTWQRITFDPKGKTYKRVQLAGEVNSWNPANTYLTLKDGIWQTDLLLNPGKYQYQLVIDGKWMLDPANPEKMPNGMGGYNSVFHVGSVSPPGVPFLITDKADKNSIRIGCRNRVKEYFAFWQNYRLGNKFLKTDSAGLVVTLPKKARQFERSFLRIWAVNAAGSSNEILVPLHDGKVILDPAELTRGDKEAMVIYFLMVDRFCDGDPKNDAPVKDKDLDPKVNFMGGDLAGIEQKINDGYFSGLGINTIWISPVTQNPPDAWTEYLPPHRKFSGYHGYWPVTLTTVDNHFGTGKEFAEMAGVAHDHGLNILLDYVSHHVHQESKIYRDHPDWFTSLMLKNGKKNLRMWDEQRLTTWFDEFLPTLDLTKPEVYQMLSDSALFWVRDEHIDGFRHDATKHIPEIYWRTLTQKINEQVVVPENRPVYQIGETYGSRELIKSYINPGELDAQFDFDLYFTAKNVFGGDFTFRDLAFALQESFNYYGEHHLMGNITGNQDQPRFISLASGALSVTESSTEAGWKRDVEVKDTAGYKMLASLIAFNMTIPGIPVIYYGDEYGMPGANDPDNRRMMKFDHLTPQESATRATVQKLIRLRREELPLIYGDFRILKLTDKVFVYLRSYFDQVAVVIFNKDDAPKKIEFDAEEVSGIKTLQGHFGTPFTRDKQKISLTLPGYSFEILTDQP